MDRKSRASILEKEEFEIENWDIDTDRANITLNCCNSEGCFKVKCDVTQLTDGYSKTQFEEFKEGDNIHIEAAQGRFSGVIDSKDEQIKISDEESNDILLVEFEDGWAKAIICEYKPNSNRHERFPIGVVTDISKKST